MTPETATATAIAFINVHVTAVPSDTLGTYTFTCQPESVYVGGPTIINFQLVQSTSGDLKFTNQIDKRPGDKLQLSDPSVSTDGKMLTLSNVHSWIGLIDVSLHVTDKDKGAHKFDPQIRNEPQGT